VFILKLLYERDTSLKKQLYKTILPLTALLAFSYFIWPKNEFPVKEIRDLAISPDTHHNFGTINSLTLRGSAP